jgi:hypothetical protein
MKTPNHYLPNLPQHIFLMIIFFKSTISFLEFKVFAIDCLVEKPISLSDKELWQPLDFLALGFVMQITGL